MKHMTKSYMGLLLVVLIAASCGPVTAVPTATKITIPTNTIIPTHISLPEPSSTATLSPVERIFTIPTRQSDLVNTPTPIATPKLETSLMRLRGLSEEDYFNLIYEMNEYSYQNFPPFDDWWTEGNYIASQETVAFAIQEYLYRFPESPNSDRLRWQLAFINSIMYDGLAGNQYGDEWMIGEMEKSLNRGEVAPDQLESFLGKYWLDVTYVKPMENLFSDGATGWLYQVVPQVSEEAKTDKNHTIAEGSMFFVVREYNKNQFETYLLNSAWNLSFGTSYVFDVIDHNQNGIPEIALYIGGHGGTTCSGNLFIYEWEDNSFIELTEGSLLLRDCSENFEYSEIGDIPAINFSRIFPVRKEQYIWNGDYYEFSQYLDSTPLQVWWNSARSLSYHDEAELINEILASGEVPSAAFSDYLRYRLGTVYAFDSKGDKAIREFQDLISSPADPTRIIFPDMAKKFLERYKGEMSLYDACHQSRLIYENAFDATRDSSSSTEDEKYQETFGFPFDPLSFGYIPCDEDDAFRIAVNSVSLTVENVPAELGKMGVEIDYTRKVDANLDGNAEEWLVIFDTYNKFLVFPKSSHYQANGLDTAVGDDSAGYSSIQVDVKSWNKFHNPVMIVWVGQEFELVEIDENYESKSLIYDFNVMDYSVSNQDDFPQFQIFYSVPDVDAYYPDHPWSGYRWDSEKNEFKDDLLEYILFVLHDPQEAVEIVEQLLPSLERWKNIPDIEAWSLPYTCYLVGLSYELSGNQHKAAQIYWQLWHDYPDSHYARLAEFKLEPVSP